MDYYELIETHGHEQVTFFYDKNSGLRAIVAIHDTTLGPAMGGARLWPYGSDEEALIDALRLSKGMTYKAAAAGLRLGGGKAVIIGNPKTDKSELLFRSFGKCVDTLGGRYITAEDVGTDVNDMEYVFMETPHVAGIDISHGGSGDPSPFAAYGVYQGMKAAVERAFGSDSLYRKTVALQGLGHVGWELAKVLLDQDADIVATDIDADTCQRARDELGIRNIVEPDEIYETECDVFAPCALGSVFNDNTVDRLKCKIIAGAANNQLKDNRCGDVLEQRKIIYAPDYVVNAGGLMNVYVELEGYSRRRALRICRGIYYNTRRVFEIGEQEGIATYKAADLMVERRIADMAKLQTHFNTFPREKLARWRQRAD